MKTSKNNSKNTPNTSTNNNINVINNTNENKSIPKPPLISSLLKHKAIYLFLILIVALSLPLISNYWQNKPLIMGEESYYHLSNLQEINWKNFYYLPLKLAASMLGDKLLFLMPIFLALSSLAMLLMLSKKFGLSDYFTFIFLLFFITTPAVIFNYITISAHSAFLFLTLLGFILLLSKHPAIKYLSIILFVLATFIDTFTSLFLLLLLAVYFLSYHKEERNVTAIIFLGIVLLFTILNYFIFNVPLQLGPFQTESYLPDLISDLGGTSGIPFFILLLAVLGIITARKEKSHSNAYIFLPLVILAYLYSTHYIFLLMLVAVFFAAHAFIRLFEPAWSLENLKKFTILFLVLGLLFSTLTYLSRATETGPSYNEVEALSWIKENIPEENLVFSLPDDSYYIHYFSGKQPYYYFHESRKVPTKVNITKTILTSTYTSMTFPLLINNNIFIIYITPLIKQKYSSDQGLLFLLTNERFKLVYSNEGTEVWMFK